METLENKGAKVAEEVADPDKTQRPHSRNAEEKKDWRSYVGKYADTAEYPFEINETVWIVKPGLRAPIGEFRISKALPNDMFDLVKVDDNSPHPDQVEGKHLRRDPY